MVVHQPEHLDPWLCHASVVAAAASDPATLVAQLLTIAIIEAGPDSAPSLAEASAGAAQSRNLPAQLWRESVQRELVPRSRQGTCPASPRLPSRT